MSGVSTGPHRTREELEALDKNLDYDALRQADAGSARATADLTWRGRTYFHDFLDDDLCVEYSATVHPSMTEVDIWKAWQISTEQDVSLDDDTLEKYTAFIAEHHTVEDDND